MGEYLLAVLLLFLEARSATDEFQLSIRDNTQSSRIAIGCDILAVTRIRAPVELNLSIWKKDMQQPVMWARLKVESKYTFGKGDRCTSLNTTSNTDFSPNAVFWFCKLPFPPISFWLNNPPSSHCGDYHCLAGFSDGKQKDTAILQVGTEYGFCKCIPLS